MPSPSVTSLGLFALAIFLYLYWTRFQRGMSKLPLPPGPPQLPLIGNLFDMPTSNDWVLYEKWSRQYGSDIIHVHVAGTYLIVINSMSVLKDLFVDRSAIYSSRMRMPMVNELMGWDFTFAFRPYGELWRAERRIFHQEFQPKAAVRFRPLEVKATHDLLRHLLDAPDDWMAHIRHHAGAIILSIAYGIEVLPENDPVLDNAEKAARSATAAMVSGAFLVDFFPILKYVPAWLPGAGFKRKARAWKKLVNTMVNVPFQAALRKIEDGDSPPSFVSYCLQNLDHSKDESFQRQLIQNTAGTMFIAGSDTTVSVLNTLILALVLHPEAQAKAQAELDAVVGKGHLPDFSDGGRLHYVPALIKEVLRWQVATPISIPHLLMKEDTYRGYRFPAGAIVVPNTWAILQDEKVYPDPSTFRPERFLKDGKLDPDIPDPELAAFGYGRRICPGRHMALDSIWIAAVSILSTFNIEKPIGEDGKIIEPSGEYSSSAIRHPLPFRCNFRPRSEEMEGLVRSLTSDKV